MQRSNYTSVDLYTASVALPPVSKRKTREQNDAYNEHGWAGRHDTADGRSLPGDFIGAFGVIAPQQGFARSDYQHAEELFQFSVAPCKKPSGYAPKLDIVDTYDPLEYRASVPIERPRPATCANSRDASISRSASQ